VVTRRGIAPIYDLIFIDGAKKFSTDGLAVLLAEKLLRPDGWLLLDDLTWTYDNYVGVSGTHYDVDVGLLSDTERTEPHLQAVFDLLIRPHPSFDQFLIQDNWWMWAHKIGISGKPS
jgi:predicted O-methyltransferase YrrM